MAIDTLEEVRKIYTNFNKGLVTRIDDREATDDSLANVVGFNLAEKLAMAKKDFGYSKYFATLPTGLTAIYGISAFRIELLNDEFIVLFGTKADNLPHFWVRKYRSNTASNGTGTISSSGVDVTGAGTAFLTELSISKHIISNGQTRKIASITSDTALTTTSAFSPVLAGQSFVFNKSTTQDAWVELTEYESTTITTRDNDSVFRSSGLLSSTNFYYNNWMIFNDTRDSYGFVVAYDGALKQYTIDETHTLWQSGDTVKFYRFPDTFILGILDTVVGSSTWYSDSVSQDRLSIGWQRNVPTRETALFLSYQSRKYFLEEGVSSNKYLLNEFDQLYFDREIPDYSSLEELGVFIDIARTNANRIDPTSDSLVAGWTGYGAGAAIFDRLDDGETSDNTNGATSTSPPNSIRPLEVGMTSVAIPTSGTMRIGIVASVSNGGRHVEVFLNEIVAGNRVARGYAKKFISSFGYVTYDIPIKASEWSNSVTPVIRLNFQFISPPGLQNTADLNVTHIKAYAISDASGASRNVRLVCLPEFDNYLLGRPVLVPFTVDNVANTYYPRVSCRLADMNKRLSTIFIFTDEGDSTKILDETVSAFRVEIGYRQSFQPSTTQNSRENPFNIVRTWSKDTVLNVYTATNSSASVSDPPAIAIGRDTTNLVKLKNWLGYGIVNSIPDISTKWRYEVKAALGQQAVTAIDEDDNVLRLSLYDGQKVHNDHIFPNVTFDNAGNPLKIFLTARGELFNILGQLGRIYAMKRSTIEVIYASTTQSKIYEADIIAKKSTIFTSIGIVYAGKYSISVLPIDGGLRGELSEAIRDEYIALSDSAKSSIQAIECKDVDCIIFSMPTVQYFYHTKLKIWWKRKFNDAPVAFTKIADNRTLVASSTKVLVYPDRTVYTDDAAEVGWVIETQWMTLGFDDVQKVIRSVIPVILAGSAIKFKVNVYLDRNGNPADSLTSDGTPFDVLYGTTVNGIYEKTLKMKLPHNFKEVKLVFKKDPADVAVAGRLDLVGMKMFGETQVTGREN